MFRAPSYLRVVVTARCSLACSYCHQEGDPASEQSGGLSTDELDGLLAVAQAEGIRKLKLLGGEPLIRRDLPILIAGMRRRDPSLDISLITGGAVPVARLEDCFDAGLSRANLSIHGWSLPAFAERTQRGPHQLAQRQAMLTALLERGRFLKLNFVWRGAHDDVDLAELLDWAAGQPVVVGVLDELSRPGLGPAAVIATLNRLRGVPVDARPEPDPHSLPTLRMKWADGLHVEVKDQHLGEVAPWRSCMGCPVRSACKEGIHALRLTHDGRLRPCMDRPDVGVDLATPMRRAGAPATRMIWRRAVRTWTRPASSPQEEAA